MNTETIIFNDELHIALEFAKKYALEYKNNEYDVAHLLKATLHSDLSLIKELEKKGKDVFFIEEWAEVKIEDLPKTYKNYNPEPSKKIDDVINEAEDIRQILNLSEIDLLCVIIAIITPSVGFNFDQLKTLPITRTELLTEINNIEYTQNKDIKIKYVLKYCKNKLDDSQKESKKIIAREKELKEIIEIIGRFTKPNILLQGYPGVGKTMLINGLINLIKTNQLPDKLSKSEIYELDLGNLFAGATYKSETEDRLRKVLQELNLLPKVILIIDGIHALLDKNSDNIGISNILKNELLKGNITLLATTTVDEYTKKIEKDENLSGMFEIIKVEEPSDQQAFRMIRSSIKPYAKHHDIKINDDVIIESIRLSKRFLKEKSLPESALNLLDRTMSVIKTAGDSYLKEKDILLKTLDKIKNKSENQKQELIWFLEDLNQKAHFLLIQENYITKNIDDIEVEDYVSITDNLLNKLEFIAKQKKEHIEIIDLAAIVAKKTGIPLGKLQSQEKERLQNMEDILKNRVVGQDLAIKIVSESILEQRSGLGKSGQPIGSFFFLGPTGTGKTELAKSIADFLFQDENAIIRFDMSEFKEEHSAALLYGAPPGYVGYEEGGLLVNKIRQKPYSIVLFDEIEKAHPSIFDVFLQIMDEGKLHDRLGKEGDFSNALVLFTSNIGSQFIVDSVVNHNVLPTSNKLMEIMSRNFRPEFLGRLTEIIPFSPLKKENALGIFEIHLKKELFDLLKNLNINLEITDEAKNYLVDNGFNSTYGARPLKGIIRSELRRPLAKKIIKEQIKSEQNIIVELKDNQLEWIIK